MIISDLEHLEVVAEASSVVGGTGKKQKQHPKNIVFKVQLPVVAVPVNKVNQANVANIKQNANAESAAVAEHGDAESSAEAVNNLVLNQANVAG